MRMQKYDQAQPGHRDKMKGNFWCQFWRSAFSGSDLQKEIGERFLVILPPP